MQEENNKPENNKPQSSIRSIESVDASDGTSGVKLRRRETPHHQKNNKVISLTGRDNSTEKLMKALSQTQEPPVNSQHKTTLVRTASKEHEASSSEVSMKEYSSFKQLS